MSVSLLVEAVLASAIVRYEQSQVSRGTTQPLEPVAPWHYTTSLSRGSTQQPAPSASQFCICKTFSFSTRLNIGE